MTSESVDIFARERVAAILIGLALSTLLAVATTTFASRASAEQGPWVLPAESHVGNERDSSRPDVSVGADGTAAIVWEQTVGGTFTAVFGRVRSPEGAWGPVQMISAANTKVLNPRVAVRDDGSVVAVWSIWSNGDFADVIEVSIRHRGGSFGSPRPLSGGGNSSFQHDIALDPAGRVHVVWVQSNGTRNVIKRMFVSPTNKLEYPGSDLWHSRGDASNPRIEIGPDGTGAIAWQLDNVERRLWDYVSYGSNWAPRLVMVTDFDPSYADGYQGRTTIASKYVDPLGPEDADSTEASHPEIEVGLDGTLLAVWIEKYGVGPVPVVQFRALSYDRSSDEWEASRIVDLHEDPTVRDPQVVADTKGSVTAIWAAGKGGCVQTSHGGRVRSAMRYGISSPEDLNHFWSVGSWVFRDLSDGPDAVFTAPHVNVGEDGTTTVVWARGENGQAIESRTRQVDAPVFGPTVRLSDPVDFGSVPRISVGADGNAMAAWNQKAPGRSHMVHTSYTAGSQPLEMSVLGEGKVVSDFPGADCGSECLSSIPFGREVTLTAVPDAGSVLAGWGGACAAVTGPVCKVSMDRARDVSVEFGPAEELVVSGSGPGVVRGTSGFSKIDCGSVCSARILRGETMVLEADPARGYSFAGWSGDCEGSGPSCPVSMDEAKGASARFARYFKLQVNRFGDGSVISEPAGVDCVPSGGSCVKAFESGTVVSLTASPGDGSVFTGWSGACAGSGLTCEVTVDQGRVVAATFVSGFEISANIMSPGSGTVSSEQGQLVCSASTCRGGFAAGSEVELSPQGQPGMAFESWTGCKSVVEGRCVVSMAGPVEVTAHFVPGESFTVGFQGGGSGRVVSAPVGVDCHGGAGDFCENGIGAGSEVTLTAVPDEGSVFVGWVKGDPADFTGGCEGLGSSCLSRVGLPVRVTARFDLAPDPEPDPEPDPVSDPDFVPGDGCVSPELQVSQLKRSGGGVATLKLRAPRSGLAVVNGPQVKKTRVKLRKAGWTRIRVKPVKRLARKLKKRSAAKTRVTVRYLTEDGCKGPLTSARVIFRTNSL